MKREELETSIRLGLRQLASDPVLEHLADGELEILNVVVNEGIRIAAWRWETVLENLASDKTLEHTRRQ